MLFFSLVYKNTVSLQKNIEMVISYEACNTLENKASHFGTTEVPQSSPKQKGFRNIHNGMWLLSFFVHLYFIFFFKKS